MFSAPSEWYRARVFAVPGQPGVALCWLAHTGIYESGYREHELAAAPDMPRHSISLGELERRY